MEEERFPHTRKPLRGRRLRVAEGGASEPRRRAQPQGCRGQWRDSRTKDRRRAALTSPRGLSAHPPGRAGLGAEARASVGSQGEDWGWRREHSPKGASVPQLARRESGKRSGAAEEARDHCFWVREERGFLPCLPTEGRAPLKQIPYANPYIWYLKNRGKMGIKTQTY